MKFYTNVFIRGNYIYIRGYENNKRIKDKVEYTPYLFVPKQNGKYTTINGIDVDKKHFDTIKEAKQFIEHYKDVDNFSIYGLTNFQYVYIYDEYFGEIKYDMSLISVVSLDIECKIDSQGFPNIEKADREITALTLRKKGKSYVFGCGDFTTNDENVMYIKCDNEIDLLRKFIKVWNFKSISPDIITGWNCRMFDLPYLINRIKNVLSETEANMLSPWGILEQKEIFVKNKTVQVYEIYGISILDYFELYKKFTFSNKESYKLDYICQEELGEKKIDYSEYGSLDELYYSNYQKYIEYNIRDAILVDKLEDKLRFIELVVTFAYDAKVNYNDIMTTVRPWDVIIHNYLLDRRIVIPQFEKNSMDKSLIGGYVKEPKIGMSKWVVSFDATSLYPMLIQQYNISPDTFKGKIDNFQSINQTIKGEYKNNTKYSITANGCLFSKDKQGFLAALMEKMYNDRDEYKKKMLDAKKEFEKSKDPQIEKLISKYHNLQLSKKIQLNSAYGALANEFFRWFNFDQAESITMSGQLTIQFIEKRINEYLNRLLNTKDKDYVIASDTDSIYLNLEQLINKLEIDDDFKIVQIIDEFCEKKLQKHLNKWCLELFEIMGAYKQKMHFKRETIANKGIWKAKKMYILNAWNIEGVQFDRPKLKMQGIEAVRASTPYSCRNAIKECLDIIMNSTEDELIKYINDFKRKFITLPFDEIAFPRTANGISKYYDEVEIYKLRTPIHVKGSLLYNHYLKHYNIKNIPPIFNGDKIKYIYLKLPNPINDIVISTTDNIPKEFCLEKYFDKELQFQKAFLEPLKSITNVINWHTEKNYSLEDFFK